MLKRKLRWGFLCVLLSGVIGCSSQPTRDAASERQATGKVTLLYQSARLGEMEPCGCHTTPYGGIDREANAVEAAKKRNPTILYVDAGNMLAPEKMRAEVAFHQKKATALLQILEGMGLEVFAPGPKDYALGVDYLKTLAGQTKVKFVSSNLTGSDGKPLFNETLIVEKAGIKFGFISITPETGVTGLGLKVEAPEKTLARLVPQVKQQADFVIVLSQLTAIENEKFVPAHPEVQFVVGTDVGLTLEHPNWYGQGSTLYLEPHRMGYKLSEMTLDIKLPFKGFYSFQDISANQLELQEWKGRLEKNVKPDQAKKEIERIETKAQTKPIEGGTTYYNVVTPLDEKGFGKKNAVSKLLTKFKESVRKDAIKGSKK